MIVIAGDIGGTKSWLALLNVEAGRECSVINEARYRSTRFDNLDILIEQFLQDSEMTVDELKGMVLAIPGPVRDGSIQLTNLNWKLSATQIKERFSLSEVALINDFQAAALGTQTLVSVDYSKLNDAPEADGSGNGVRLVIGAGTGLGMAYLYKEGLEYVPVATEGGHVDFAPVDDREIALLKYLQGRYRRVSYERILSGDGLVALYQFCVGNLTVESSETAEWINREATDGDNSAAVESLQLFASIYGRFVGNMVLALRPEDGVYLTGGVSAKVGQWLDSSEFKDAYLDKGRMLDIVAQTPVYLVTNERLGLQGAIKIASSL
ncbi:MAG: glucokinase [Gammaproteobacteria bacterium]|nr:glucokinase [Gammaproteobacteria bacterium]